MQELKKKIIILNYPVKSEIYNEQIKIISSNYKKKMFSDYAQNVFEKELGDKVKIINLKEIFLKHKQDNDLIYFADEHHVTEYGNKLVVDYLANILNFKSIEYEPQNLNIASGEFFTKQNEYWSTRVYGETFGNVFGGINTGKENHYFTPHKYKIYSLGNFYQKNIEIKYDKTCDAKINLHNKSIKNGLKVYVLGNSFVETFSKMLITSVSDVYRRRSNNICSSKVLQSSEVVKEVNILNPDIIIIPHFSYAFYNLY